MTEWSMPEARTARSMHCTRPPEWQHGNIHQTAPYRPHQSSRYRTESPTSTSPRTAQTEPFTVSIRMEMRCGAMKPTTRHTCFKALQSQMRRYTLEMMQDGSIVSKRRQCHRRSGHSSTRMRNIQDSQTQPRRTQMTRCG